MDEKLKRHLDNFLSTISCDEAFCSRLDRLPADAQELVIDVMAYAYFAGWEDKSTALPEARVCNRTLRHS